MKTKYNILIIDDSEIDRLVAGTLLEHASITQNLFYATTGEDAMKWLREYAGNNFPLIILLDIKMPEMDGIKFLEEIDKLSTGLKHVIIYILSSTLNTNEIEQAKKSRYVKRFFSKPLNPKELIEAVSSLE